jgi:hypothetical protein
MFNFDLKEKEIVVVIINKMSGGQKGNEFLNIFYKYLNPL